LEYSSSNARHLFTLALTHKILNPIQGIITGPLPAHDKEINGEDITDELDIQFAAENYSGWK